MSIESIAYDRRRPIVDKLIADGDVARAVITAEIAGGDFIAETIIEAKLPGVELSGLIVAKEGEYTIRSRVYDPDTDEEYAPIRQEGAIGSYAATVREEYQEFLNSVADSYCLEAQFLSDQANRIAARVFEVYGDELEYPFEDNDAAVWRTPNNRKWYGIIMNVLRSKVTKDKPEEGTADPRVDVMNVKINPDELDTLLGTAGIYECYHMNKKLWVSIILDGTLDDDRVMELISVSRSLVKKGSASGSKQAKAGRSYWIIPSNPVQYDVVMGFMTSPNNTISWTQRIQAEAGDYLYIYQTNPVASIMHKCEVVRANVPRSEAYGIDDIVAETMESKKTKPVMFLKLLETYPVGHYSREFMNEHGIKKTIRGQRSMPLELVEAMEQNKVLK